MMTARPPLALVLLFSVACFPPKGPSVDDSTGDTDADTDTDADSDTDSDADSDADADADADSDADSDADADYHPDGWSSAAMHGRAAKMLDQDCTACHGSDLRGGSSGVGCDSCHPSNWRTDCTFCHGGEDDATGAPPVDIDGSSTGLSFPEHGVHLTSSWHGTWDCDQCHVKPTDVLTRGHLFVGDSTAGMAEVDFHGGLSAAGIYGGGGSCSNLYCHGDGNGRLGSASTGASASCSTCHSAPPRTGEHIEHSRYDCNECHADTTTDSSHIAVPPTPHVDGGVDVRLDGGGSWDGSTCNPSCHGGERW